MIDPREIYVRGWRDPGHGDNTWLMMNGITVFHLPTGIGVTVDNERSQHLNKAKALELLETLLKCIAENYPSQESK